MKLKSCLKFIFFVIVLLSYQLNFAQDKSDWAGNYPDACTSITVGKDASVDGSVITSHTDDSHRTRSEIDIQLAKDHKASSTTPMYRREADNSMAMPSYKNIKIGEIPQVAHTYQFINSAYPCMNEKQLGIGESTFGGHDELQSDSGLIDCQRLCQLMVERCATARDAIKMADELTKKYGWNDFGECLTIADTKEVWHFEIVGPGKGKVGAVWAAQRVPDNHVSVNVNASTIKEIDLSKPDFFMASDNIFSLAKENGWWNENETFRFCYAYAPESRQAIGSRRREWRVFDLLAPSLKLDPNAENYPFSVKPDKKVSLEDIVRVFKDYYEGTPYDMTRSIKTTDSEGKTIISPLANPFMPYDQLDISNVSGGWYDVDHKTGQISFLGERTIARWYTMYATIIQCRDWLPNEIGGIAWLAMDNVATSIYIPVYCSATDIPKPYKTPGRTKGYTTESAWWAFNRLGTLTAQRWGDMRHDVDAVWVPWQKELFNNQQSFEEQALKLYDKKNPQKTIEYVTKYTNEWGFKVVNKAWELGDFLWTKYDEKF
ncbi:MAG: peptidase C69 [Bacteroidetes bacterium GWA2_31_9b]|nr:MAG: peptidase C69 [Bacteroidetes bacterium GWA2_31_9b]